MAAVVVVIEADVSRLKTTTSALQSKTATLMTQTRPRQPVKATDDKAQVIKQACHAAQGRAGSRGPANGAV